MPELMRGMELLHGYTIQLLEKTQTGTDWANAPVYEETAVDVDNVLVKPATSDDVTDTLNLHGKKVEYVLHIPKGDTHEWADREVVLPEPFAGKYRTIGYPTAYIEENTPLSWNKEVRVERYG